LLGPPGLPTERHRRGTARPPVGGDPADTYPDADVPFRSDMPGGVEHPFLHGPGIVVTRDPDPLLDGPQRRREDAVVLVRRLSAEHGGHASAGQPPSATRCEILIGRIRYRQAYRLTQV